jgi:cytidine deaminase
MSELSPIPSSWLGLAPNLDFVSPYHLELSETDISWNALNQLVLMSRRAATAVGHAYSWRDFAVGAVGFAMDPEEQRFGLFTGFNVKSSQDGVINIHAEQMVLAKARHHGFGRLDALGVLGDPQPDQQSGHQSLTLCPCGLCRTMLAEAPEVNNRMPIFGTTPDLSVCELYSLERLEAFHAGEIEELSIITPFTVTDDAIDTPGYDGALGFWLLDAWAQLNPDAAYANEITAWSNQAGN